VKSAKSADPYFRYRRLEITLNPEGFDPYRLEFYAGKLFTGQDIKSVGRT
jgi:hypothetical protein